MGNKKKLMAILVLSISAMCLMSGCKKQTKETETQTESTQETGTETEAVKNNYTSETSTFSIDLPDASWAATKEGIKQNWTFESAGIGTINITHKKTKIGKKKLPDSQEAAVALLNKEKENAFANVEFKKESTSTANLYYYAASTTDAELPYLYYVRYLVNTDNEGYIITAKLTTEDSEAVQAVKDAVTSFQILKEDGKNTETGESETADGSDESSSQETEASAGTSEGSGTSATEEEYRYFFDEEGNTIYAYPSEDGAWRDKNGMSYIFLENGVEDSNGTKYYYDPPEYRNQSSGTDSSSDNSSSSITPGQTADFYDGNGNYITATQDENGYWIGSDGKTYTFSEEGVTDSEGNFSKW